MQRIIEVMSRAITGLALMFLPAAVFAGGLVPAGDLAADARAARGVILVFFASDSCPYCHTVESLYLEPMHERRPYGARLEIRKVEVDSHAPLVDFAGRRTDHAAFARGERAGFTPLIRIYGPDGREAVESLRGFTSEHFYSEQLEGAIERALARLGSGRRVATECRAERALC
jgi:hypothetical protein